MKRHKRTTGQATGQVRIIGGEARGRKLSVLEQPGLRPTSDRVRETLFNWLQFDIAGKQCLDAFAGSGALGFEALSRGAASVTFLEQSPSVAACLQANLVQWQQAGLATSRSRVISTDTLQWLQQPCSADQAFDIIFVDPPFMQGFLAQTLERLQSCGWMHAQTWLYLEQEKGQTWPSMPSHWYCHREKTTSQVSYSLWRQDTEVTDSTHKEDHSI
jgi:16S rRNA (guanine966-N2)-methyltransferase